MTTVVKEKGGSRSKTFDMVYIAVFAVLIAICSWISIPTLVPFTMQTFALFLAVGTLGGRRGTMAVLIYLLLGAVGIPVFAEFSKAGGIFSPNILQKGVVKRVGFVYNLEPTGKWSKR